MNVHQRPIGLFDSGLGGLSVVREVRALLPAEDLVYFADSAFCPYGEREPAAIQERSLVIADELVGRGAKVLVVACNTASAVALAALRRRHSAVPIVGMVPAVKPAVAISRTGRIGVLATPRTVAGGLLAGVIAEHARGAEVIPLPAPGLADLVEAGETEGPAVEALLRPLVAPLPLAGVDTLVLGCTHYPFVAGTIRRLTGGKVALVDSSAAIARRTRHLLDDQTLHARGGAGATTLLTSGDASRVAQTAERLVGADFGPIRVPA